MFGVRRTVYFQIFAIIFLSLFFAQSANALSIITTIHVGTFPIGVAFDSGKGEMFVANSITSNVSVIDTDSNTVVATIPVGLNPYWVAYDSTDGLIFVSNAGANTVSVIDDRTNTVVGAPIAVGTNPRVLAYDSVLNLIFVVNSGSNNVYVIDPVTKSVVGAPIAVGAGANPFGIAYDSIKGEMFVTNSGTNNVKVINDSTKTVVATISVGGQPYGAVYDYTKGEIFVSNHFDNTVSIISDSTNTVVGAPIAVGLGPQGVAYNPVKGEIYVSNNDGNSVSIISDSTNGVLAVIAVGLNPNGIAFNSINKIFVANENDDTITSILDPLPSPPNVRIYHPPSLGNDYYYHYTGGAVINGKSFDVTKYGIEIPQQVLQTGQSANFTFKIYSERGASTVSHVGMYFHFKGDVSVANADTSFVWDKHDGVQVNDPEKFFSDTSITHHYDDNFAYVSIKFTPTKPMSDSSILMRMWDDKRASMDVPINGAIIIVDPNAPIPVTKVPDNQYGDYQTLVRLLDSDGYAMPPILHRIKSGLDLASAVDVYWIYDKGTDKLTMVETYKDGEIIGNTVFNLQKRSDEPTKTAHDYIYIPPQNNRQNPEQEKNVMLQEEIKAKKILESISYHTN